MAQLGEQDCLVHYRAEMALAKRTDLIQTIRNVISRLQLRYYCTKHVTRTLISRLWLNRLFRKMPTPGANGLGEPIRKHLIEIPRIADFCKLHY
jgi:hypothetical protein